MASFELIPFQKQQQAIGLTAALDFQMPAQLRLAFWINDPEQSIIYPTPTQQHIGQRCDFLWEHTCFELFIGINHLDDYREINCSPNLTWQVYQFEEYRYPEQIPPVPANDIELLDLQKTKFGLTASFNISDFLSKYNIRISDLYFGINAVIETQRGISYFALQHQNNADFHNKRTWVAQI